MSKHEEDERVVKTEEPKRVKPPHEMWNAYISVGYRGTNGWPDLFSIPLTPFMTLAQFDQCIAATNGGDFKIRKTTKDVAIFVAPIGTPVNIFALTDKNVLVDDNLTEFENFEDFAEFMNWG